jgi:hypothetical protein
MKNLFTLCLIFSCFILFGQAPVNDNCDSATQIACGNTIVDSTIDASFEINNDNCTSLNQPDLWYTIQGNGELFQFEYLSGDAGQVNIAIYEDLCSSTNNECITNFSIFDNLNNTNGFVTEDGVDYLLRVSAGGYFESTGVFNFSLTCQEAPTNDLCDNATPLPCNQVMSQTTVTLTHDNQYCTGSSSEVFHWYTLEGNDGFHVFEYISSSIDNFDFSIFEGTCPMAGESCSIERFSFRSNDPIHEFYAASGIDYIIRVESQDCCRGEVTFLHTCVVPAENDDCENAIALTCGDIVNASTNGAIPTETNFGCMSSFGDDIWYSIQGNDEIIDISILGDPVAFIQAQIFSVTCGSVEPNCLIESYNLGSQNILFYGESDTEYLLKLSTSTHLINGFDFMFTLSCRQSTTNDFCENAEIISCGSTIVSNFDNASPSYEQSLCLPFTRPDLWYRIIGDGSLLEFVYLNSISQQGIDITFSDASCGNEPSSCLNNFDFNFFTDTVQYFNAQNGVEYLINISENQPDLGSSFVLSINCLDPISNDLCTNPLDLSCGDTLIIDNTFATSSGSFLNCGNNYGDELWYTITGDGQQHIFSKLNSSFSDDVAITFKEVDCGIADTTCADFLNLNRFNNYQGTFFAEHGRDYLVAISSRLHFIDTIIHTCADLIPNNLCLDAIEINCGDSIISNSLLASNSLPDSDCNQTYGPDAWYKIIGENKFYNFKYLYSSNGDINFEYFMDCNDLNSDYRCENLATDVSTFDSTSLNFYLDTSTELYIRVTQCCREGDFGFSLQCEDITIADECLNAPTISCGSVITEDGDDAELPSFSNHCINYNQESFWYRIIGTEQVFQIDYTGDQYLQVIIFEGECIDSPFPTNCISNFNVYAQFNGENVLLEEGKSYWVQIINFQESFEFSVNCLEPLSNDNCSTAESINCGDNLFIDFESATNSLNGPNCSSSDNPDVWYSITGTDEFYIFTLSNFDDIAQLRVVLSEDATCESTLFYCPDYYLYDNGDSFQFFASEGVTYLIEVNLRCCETPPVFNFEITCAEAPINDSCENPTPIACGQTSISGSTAFADKADYTSTCNNRFDNDVWYSFVGDNNFYEFEQLSSVSSLTDIDIFSGACDSLICELNTSVSSTSSPFFAEQGVSYYMSVSPCCDLGDFEIALNCIYPSGNDVCEMATPIVCGDIINTNTENATPTPNLSSCEEITEHMRDIWYTFVGDGSLYRFSNEGDNSTLEIYSEGCNVSDLICEKTIDLAFSNSFATFHGQAGITYYVRAVRWFYSNVGNVAFSLDCYDQAVNDICENSIQIGCGDLIIGNTANASEEDISTPCGFENTPDLWYTIVGDGLSYAFELLTSANDNLFITIREGQCGMANDCNDQLANIGESINFVAQEDIVYSIRIVNGHNNNSPPGEFSFRVSCTTPPSNDNCNSPTELYCGNTISGTTEFASFNPLMGPCSYIQNNDLWYSFEGNDSLLLFTYDHSENNQPLSFFVYNTSSCDDIYADSTFSLCQTQFTIRPSSPSFSFFAEEGIDYNFQMSLANDSGEFSFDMDCAAPLLNDLCEGAVQGYCGGNLVSQPALVTSSTDSIECINSSLPDVWYTILGDGNIYNLSLLEDEASGTLTVLTGDCLNLTCIEQSSVQGDNTTSTLNFLTEPGIIYYINAKIRTNISEYTLNIECNEAVPNDLIENAQPISCGDDLISNTTFTSNTESQDLCSNQTNDDLWYLLNGTGDVTYLNYNFSDVEYIYVEIYTQSSSGLSCIYEERITAFRTAFFTTEANVDYYIRVHTSTQNSSFSLTHSCSQSPENTSCQTSTPISCLESIDGTFFGAGVSTIPCFSNQDLSGVWYSIIGDGNSYYFDVQSQSQTINGQQNTTIYVLEGDCDTDLCTQYEPTSGIDFNFIFLQEGIEYFIFVTNNNSLFFDFSIEAICNSENTICTDAIPVSCNTPVVGSSIVPEYSFEFLCGSDVANNISWYTFTGTGEHVRLNVDTPDIHHISVHESTCDDLNCLELDRVNPVFFAEAEIDYIVAVYAMESIYSSFTFTVLCNYFEITDPCVCNNDQELSEGIIGSFNETVSVNNTTENEIWTVIEIQSENGETKPRNIAVGDVLIYDQTNQQHNIEFKHFDGFGYSITVEGPKELGHVNNVTASISNVCSYPNANLLTDDLNIFIDDTIQLNHLISELNKTYNYELIISDQQYEFPVSALKIGGGIHSAVLRILDTNGCFSEQEFSIIIDVENEIPTIGQWGLVCLLLLFLIVGVIRIKDNQHIFKASG